MNLKQVILLILKVSGISAFILTCTGAMVFFWFAKGLPRPQKFTETSWTLPTEIYDRTGKVLLYEIYGEEKRTKVSLDKIPAHLQWAVVLNEDQIFYSHPGIDFKAIIRAVLADLRTGKPTQGGSTIPQQLIRSTFLTKKKTVKRKIREIILSIELDRRYSKKQILEWYLNQVSFGSNAYGVERASQTFFGKPVSELSLAEGAVLASLIQAPGRLSPYGQNKALLLKEKDQVLTRMFKKGLISEKQLEQAKSQKIKFAEPQVLLRAPHFTLRIKSKLEQRYGIEELKTSGFKVRTTLDWDLQKAAQKAIQEWSQINKAYSAHNASLIAIDPQTGQVLAMVGSKDWSGDPFPEDCVPGKTCLFDPKVNVAFRKRQPGSAFKPFVYATAFKKGASDQDTVIDEKTNFGVWGGKEYVPENYDHKFRGEVTLRQALAQSLNVPSVKVLLNLAGIEDSIKTAKEMGIDSLKDSSFYGPSLVLGGGEVKLFNMVSGYGVFATEGLKTTPHSILEIKDHQDQVIFESQTTPKRIIEQDISELINDILSDNETRAPMFGTHSALYFKNKKIAAKTGTTQNYEDAWTIGYNFGSDPIAIGVWVGNSNREPMRKGLGARVAAPIWHQVMEYTLSN